MPSRAKAQNGLQLIYEAMLDLLAQYPGGLSHAKIAKALGLEMRYSGGKNYASQTILHQLVYTKKVAKVGEARNAIFRLRRPSK